MNIQSALGDAFTILRHSNIYTKSISSLAVRYHKPYVNRISITLNNKPEDYNRIYFHKIFPCKPEESLYHPHPWPSIVHVVKGSYFHQIGTKDEIICSQILSKGSVYDMENPKSWHRVAPTEETLSIMLVKDFYPNPEPFEKPKEKQRELHHDELNDVILAFLSVENKIK